MRVRPAGAPRPPPDAPTSGEARMDTTVSSLPPHLRGGLPYGMALLDIGPEVDWRPEHLAASAWLEHVPFAYWLVKALRPRCFVELGTHWGVSYAAFCQAVERF